MSKGKRYNGAEHKLNIKKVIAVIITILVIIMSIVVFARLLKPKNSGTEKKVAMAYYAAFDNNKWGIINSSGETVIQPEYDEMIIVPNKEKPVFIVMYDVNYTDNTYKTKAIDEKNKQLFAEYEQVEVIQNYDNQNNLWYEENCLKVKRNNKYGLIDLSGKVLLDCNYDSIDTPDLLNEVLLTGEEKAQVKIEDHGISPAGPYNMYLMPQLTREENVKRFLEIKEKDSHALFVFAQDTFTRKTEKMLQKYNDEITYIITPIRGIHSTGQLIRMQLALWNIPVDTKKLFKEDVNRICRGVHLGKIVNLSKYNWFKFLGKCSSRH